MGGGGTGRSRREGVRVRLAEGEEGWEGDRETRRVGETGGVG